MNELYGVPVVVYDGTNAEAIVKAMHLEPGDAVVVLDKEKSILIRGSQLEKMMHDPTARHDISGQYRPHQQSPTGLVRRLLEEGET